jgi:hypothetical protein
MLQLPRRRTLAVGVLEVPAVADSRTREISMLLGLFIVLLIMWMLGFFAFHVAGALIHILLVVALISLVMHLFMGRTA